CPSQAHWELPRSASPAPCAGAPPRRSCVHGQPRPGLVRRHRACGAALCAPRSGWAAFCPWRTWPQVSWPASIAPQNWHGAGEGRGIIPADPGLYRAPRHGFRMGFNGRWLALYVAVSVRRVADGNSGEGDRRCGLPALLSSLRDNGGVDSATHVEARGQAQETRAQCLIEGIGDLGADRLMKGAAIAEGPDGELQ